MSNNYSIDFRVSILAFSLLVTSLPLAISQSTIAHPLLAQSASQDLKTAADHSFKQGIEHYQTNQLEKALHFWKQALKRYQQLKDPQAEGATLGALGAVYLALGDYNQAEEYSQRFLAIARKLSNLEGQAQALGNLGIAYKRLGRYPEAISSQNQALEIMRKLQNRQAEGQLLLNLGNTREVMGDYDAAIAAYEQSLTLARQSQDLRGEGTALGNLGAIYADKGDDRKALAFYQQGLKLAESTQDSPQQISILINIGTVYYFLEQRNLTIDYYQRSLSLAQKLGDRKLQGEVLSNLGLIYEDQKEFAKAIQAHQQSVAIAQTSKDPRAEAQARNNLGHTLFYAGELAESEKNLRTAVKLLDSLRSGLGDFDQVNIFDTQVFTYNLLQQVLIAANKPEAALEASEQGRARAFAQLLASRLAVAPSAKKASQSSSVAVISAPSIAQIRQIARQQNATLVSYAIVPDAQFRFRGKQRAKAAGLFIWVVKPAGNVEFRQVDLNSLSKQQITLEELVQVARCLSPTPLCPTLEEFVQSKQPAAKQTDEPTTSSQSPIPYYPGLKELHQLLIAPISDLLPTNPSDRVVFIPQESLFLVPFAALQDTKEKFLVEQHTVLSAPSIQVLDFTHQQRLRSRSRPGNSKQTQDAALVVGNPTMPKVVLTAGNAPEQLKSLPGSEQEAQEIAKLLKTTAIIGAEATKANILQKLSKARFVHLATHGLLEYGSQQGSLQTGVPGAIALAPSGKDDGLLTATEILNFRLNAELVVLSACDTGQGRITGDGVIGLSRAWISAQVPSVIVSLWAVPDAQTALLMTLFYQNLQHTSDKAQALRQAMLTTMQEYPQPLDWAAFTLIGEAE